MNLRARLSLGAGALAALAIAAAVTAAIGIGRTEALMAEAMGAQHRIESYSSLSARTNEWLLSRLAGGREASPFAVTATLDLIDALVAEDIAAAPDAASAAERGRQRMVAARVRGQFDQLRQTIDTAPAGTPEVRAAVAFYGVQVPALIAAQIQQDARRREVATEAVVRQGRWMRGLAFGLALATPLALLAAHLAVVRPLVRRLRHAGEGRDRAHDELGLALARIRRRTRRLDRAQARLEAVVAARTAELSRANDRLSRADAERRRFFADVSHELRTPLTVIMGEAEMGLDTAHRDSFATILSRAERLHRRIEDLLRIARSDSGRLDLACERVEVRAVLTAAGADMAPVLARAGVRLEVLAADVAVAGDPDWLRQIFAALLDNAARHAAGSVVTIRADAGDDARITITDTGPGIPPDRIAAAMERFEGGGRGFGLGLPLIRWVVESHGGTISAGTAQGGGLALSIRLPLYTTERKVA